MRGNFLLRSEETIRNSLSAIRRRKTFRV